MNPVFLAFIRKHRLAGQKRVGQRSCKSTYEFRPPAEPECRHEPIWSPVAANLRDDEDEVWGDDEEDDDNDE